MGSACSCLASPKAHSDEAVHHRDRAADYGARPAPPSAASAGGAATPRPSLGWYSAAEDACSDIDEDDWHDAMSDIGSDGLADALEEFEERAHFHDPSVDRAIEVLKAHGHLLPPALEALAEEQRTEDREAARQLRASAEGAALVTVQAALRPGLKPEGLLPELERTRSQRLLAVLREPGVQALLAEASEDVVNGRVLAAHDRLKAALQAAGGSSLAELAALSPEALSAALPPGTILDVAGVAADVAFVHEALEALEDHKGWMVSRSDALKVYYRHQRGTTVHSLKFSAVFDHPLEHLLALAYEFDLVVTWNKFSLASVKLAEPSIFESFVYGAQWMMRPFKHMQGLLRCRGYDLADEHRCLLVSLQDCAPEALPADAKPLPPEFGKRKLVNFLPGSCMKLRPLPAAPDGTPRTEGSLLIHLDPHIPFIPAFLLNFVLGVLAPYIFNQMRTVLDKSFADESGAYSQRIAGQPELYGLVRSRMAQYADYLRPQTEEEAAAEAAAVHKSSSRRKSNRLGTP